MPTTSGRNNRLETFWRTITGWTGKLFNTPTGQTSPTIGQTVATHESPFNRRFDQEYVEIPVRDVFRARNLIGLRQMPEVATAIDTLVGDVFSSEDGDDMGMTIAPTLADGSLIDPRMYQIALDCIDRVCRGTDLWTVVEEFLIYGDSFRSILLDSKMSRIERIKQLPTWEIFRVEDLNGDLLRFEQRNMISGPAQFEIHPMVCVHWRYRRYYKYGRSVFEEILEDAAALDTGYYALDKAAIAIGVNPNVHIMPNGWNDKQRDSYRLGYEREKEQGKIVTDFYTAFGGDIKKLGGTWNPDLGALLDNVLQRRARIAMRSRIPPWMLGLPTQGPREIAGQPALAYARFIGTLRIILAEGVRQIIDLELALNGFTAEQLKYRLVFPKIYTSTQAQSAQTATDEETNLLGIEDLDSFRADLNKYSTFSLKS
jgi:hypothetical protein